MTLETLRFFNDIIRPWEELNDFLQQPYAVQFNLSSITTKAWNLATNISHYPELIGKKRFCSIGITRFQAIDDMADSSKHGKLSKPSRQCEIEVDSIFEVNDAGQYNFLRNAVIISHATLGEIDFMPFTLNIINYWLKELQDADPTIHRQLVVKENSDNFGPTAKLEIDFKYCVEFKSTKSRFFNRLPNQDLVPLSIGITVAFELFQKTP